MILVANKMDIHWYFELTVKQLIIEIYGQNIWRASNELLNSIIKALIALYII